MQLLLYILLYPILWLISILPFRVLYLISDVICFVVYRVIKYRKKTVRENIRLALPNLSEEEQLRIERKFYIHLCDIFIEMIKTISISRAAIDKRYRFTNLENYLEMEKQGKSIALLCAHYASYEWAVSMNHYINFRGYGIYKKLANPYFDRLVRNIRSKFKATLITTKETIPTIIENHKLQNLSVYGFASDQSPKIYANTYWSNFMGINVPVHTNAENLAKKYDMNVIFLKTKKIRRGFYEASFENIIPNNQTVSCYPITEEFLRLVEQQIIEQPEYYLWTHKRWKHQKTFIN